MERLTVEVLRRYPGADIIPASRSLWGTEGDIPATPAPEPAANLGAEFAVSPRTGAALLFEHRGERYGYVKLRTGAPLAAAGLERLIALGARQVVVTGGAGTLFADMGRGQLLLPTRAIREEGTSYHYLRAARFVRPSPTLVVALGRAMEALGYPYRVGTTWTTDAIYRETRAKIGRLRLREGAICVEMETAALFAVGRFRKVEVAALLYASDAVGGAAWDFHNHQGAAVKQSRAVLLDVALKAFELAARGETPALPAPHPR